MPRVTNSSLTALRDRIRQIEHPARHGVLPFGVAALDGALPGGGLALGAVHEILGAGGETAGIPFAAWIADRLSLPMLYVRKQPKGFGRNAQIEGELKDEARILLVEDLASEGTSKLNFVRAIRQAGGRIEDAFVIFNYGIFPQIDTSLAAEGITLLALATWWDVAATAERLGRFGPGQYAAVESFLKNPEAWSKTRAAQR